MATPVRGETRNVIDDNISARIQSKVKTNDTVRQTPSSLRKVSIKDEQVRQYQRNLNRFKTILNGLKAEEEKLSEAGDIQMLAEKLLKLGETIDKVENRIVDLVEKIQLLETNENNNILHEHIDATGTYYLFDTLTSTNKRFYPKDCVFDYRTNNVENIPILLNNFKKFIKKYQFDDVFENDIIEIDPRENEILCKIIKEGLGESLDIMNTNTTDIFRIIDGLKNKYRSLHGRDVRIRAWEKVLVDTTCRNSALLMNKLQKLVLMEKWIFSKCCQDCPNLKDYLQEAIMGTLHESLRNSVKQRLYNIPHDVGIDHEEFLINTVIETVIDLSPIADDQIENSCMYCKSVFHCSINCKKKPNRELRPDSTNFSKTYYLQGAQRQQPLKSSAKRTKVLEQDTKKVEQSVQQQKTGNY